MRWIALVVSLVLLLASPALAGRRAEIRRNRIKRYVTCATCPRSVVSTVLDKDVIQMQRKEQGTAYGSEDRLFHLYQKATWWFLHGKFTREVRWDAQTGFVNSAWNHWEEVAPREVHKDGGPGPPPWRYRRTEFTFHACWPVVGCVLNSHAWIAQTVRASKSYPYTPAHSW